MILFFRLALLAVGDSGDCDATESRRDLLRRERCRSPSREDSLSRLRRPRWPGAEEEPPSFERELDPCEEEHVEDVEEDSDDDCEDESPGGLGGVEGVEEEEEVEDDEEEGEVDEPEVLDVES